MMGMKLKPVRGEIQTTNPMRDLGSSLIDAVRANEPSYQKIANAIDVQAQRQINIDKALEKTRQDNHNTLQGANFQKRLLDFEFFVEKGDPQKQNQMYDIAVLEKMRKEHFGKTLQEFKMNHYAGGKDPAYGAFESLAYGEGNLSYMRIKKIKEKKIKFDATVAWATTKESAYNDVSKRTSWKNYWAIGNLEKDLFKINLNKAKNNMVVIDVKEELDKYDLHNWKNYFHNRPKNQKEDPITGKMTTDYIEVYNDVNTGVEKDFIEEIPFTEYDKSRIKFTHTTHFDKEFLPDNIREDLLTDAKKQLTRQVYIETKHFEESNQKIIQEFYSTYKEGINNMDYYLEKLKGPKKYTIYNELLEANNDMQTGKTLTTQSEYNTQSFIFANLATWQINSITKPFLTDDEKKYNNQAVNSLDQKKPRSIFDRHVAGEIGLKDFTLFDKIIRGKGKQTAKIDKVVDKWIDNLMPSLLPGKSGKKTIAYQFVKSQLKSIMMERVYDAIEKDSEFSQIVNIKNKLLNSNSPDWIGFDATQYKLKMGDEIKMNLKNLSSKSTNYMDRVNRVILDPNWIPITHQQVLDSVYKANGELPGFTAAKNKKYQAQIKAALYEWKTDKNGNPSKNWYYHEFPKETVFVTHQHTYGSYSPTEGGQKRNKYGKYGKIRTGNVTK